MPRKQSLNSNGFVYAEVGQVFCVARGDGLVTTLCVL